MNLISRCEMADNLPACAYPIWLMYTKRYFLSKLLKNAVLTLHRQRIRQIHSAFTDT